MSPDKNLLYCLLVDDLDENLVALEALLRREGLVCLKARSGDEALELLLVHDVALAFLDVQMPGMDGFQLAEFMRGSERTRHIPIIFLTAGSADRQRRFRGYEAGAVDFIHKPIEGDILRSKAAVFFDLHEQRRHVTAQRDELEAMTRALQAADQHKNRFLAILGHELRNPIMALTAGLHLLEKRDGTPAARDVRNQMERHVRHLSRLIEDLLDVARLDQGKISLRKERLRLQDVLSFAIESSQPQIDAGDHELVLDIPPEPIWLEADHARLAQIVTNLLNNAAKYTPTGGRVQLAAAMIDGQIVIEVADNGIGIPADKQAHIFDLFTQVKDVNSAGHEGLGIGLALVRQLVELHGGTIALKSSAPGEGSTFRLCLTPG
ncbi:hybrid sensor histidine kinase/response regulator [Sphingobium chungbukense]|uniref:histidine kinase n=1 Tax=Sphingobium chungbukense TaxID=56193 RepID=A0A0M3AI32_9SPHN|nr:hybrid sensor histidine kinase/response regulator [Sphingobium chungbukense]KKW89510.1 histidine kinase [Sphingobium chungbukense]